MVACLFRRSLVPALADVALSGAAGPAAAHTGEGLQADLVHRQITPRAFTSAPDLVAASAYLAGAVTGSAASGTTGPGLWGREYRVTRQQEGKGQ